MTPSKVPAPTTSKRQIRRIAATIAIVWGLVAVVLSLSRGHPAALAFEYGATAFLTSGIAWSAYHLVSRSNNGIGIMIPALPITLSRIDQAIANRPIRDLIVWASLGVLVGLSSRAIDGIRQWKSSKPDHRPTADRPLWDAHLDGPAAP